MPAVLAEHFNKEGIRTMFKITLLSTALTCFSLISNMATADTLDQVRERGKLECGVSQGAAGFSLANSSGQMEGLDADICRAVAAAVLKDPNAVDFVQLSSNERFVALQAGRVDMLARTTTQTLSRDMDVGVDFAAINFFDGQGFLVPKKLGITDPKQLDGAVICLRQGSSSVQNLADYFGSLGIKYTPLLFEQSDEVVKAYGTGRCDAYSIDRAVLAGDRLKLHDPNEHVILDAVISKEPLALVVRQNDSRWADVVRWSFWALVNAEELGVTAATVSELAKTSTNPEVLRLLGKDSNYGEKLGLDAEFGLRAISAVGNYGEIFDRSLGKDSSIKLSRGPNELWNHGGLMYAAPWH